MRIQTMGVVHAHVLCARVLHAVCSMHVCEFQEITSPLTELKKIHCIPRHSSYSLTKNNKFVPLF